MDQVTLGKYYQGKPELLQAMLDNMESEYNTLQAEVAALRAQLATLRKLWAELPAGYRAGLQAYHPAEYRKWVEAMK